MDILQAEGGNGVKVMSRIAGFTCRDCGAALPYFRTSATEPDRKGNRREPAVACPSCGARMRLTRHQGRGRIWRWGLSRVPTVIVTVIALVTVLYLQSEPRQDPALISVIILALALLFMPALFVASAIQERIEHDVEKAGD